MHVEVTEWLSGAVEVEWDGARVYEVGSADWNGRASDFVPRTWDSWTGIDIVAAPNVSIVADAVAVLPFLVPCDVIVSTEVFEHAANWCEIVGAMCGALRSGGWFVATCAGTGRPVHSADGAPTLRDGEHYANVSLDELVTCCASFGVDMVRGEEGPPCDTRFIGRKW